MPKVYMKQTPSGFKRYQIKGGAVMPLRSHMQMIQEIPGFSEVRQDEKGHRENAGHFLISSAPDRKDDVFAEINKRLQALQFVGQAPRRGLGLTRFV